MLCCRLEGQRGVKGEGDTDEMNPPEPHVSLQGDVKGTRLSLKVLKALPSWVRSSCLHPPIYLAHFKLKSALQTVRDINTPLNQTKKWKLESGVMQRRSRRRIIHVNMKSCDLK